MGNKKPFTLKGCQLFSVSPEIGWKGGFSSLHPGSPRTLDGTQEMSAPPPKGLTCALGPGWVRRCWSVWCAVPHTRPPRLASESLFLGSDLLTLTLCATQSEKKPEASASPV